MDGQQMQDDNGNVDSSATILAISPPGTLEANVGLQVSEELHTTVIGADIEEVETKTSNLVCTTSSIFDPEAQERVSCKDGSEWRTATFASSVLAMLGAVGLIAILIVVIRGYLSGQWHPTVTDYGIVFDAGSTHTAMMLYGWSGEEKRNGTGTPHQLFKCIVDGDGISSYANGGEDRLSSAISVCLEEGRSWIPPRQVASCPVFFGATAGMRLLNVQDPVATRRIMDSVVNALSASRFRFNSSMSRIMSGDEEGAAGWIQTNYLSKSLFGELLLPVLLIDQATNNTMSKSKNSVIGMLDLGGASTQFAAIVPEGLSVHFMPMNLYGNFYNVSVHSYLCFGRRQAQARHKALLVLGLPVLFNGVTIEDPCLPQGYNITVALQDLFNSPCTWADVWRPRSSLMNPDINVTFVGTSSSSQCTTQVRSQLNFTVCRDVYKFTNCFEEHDLTAHGTSFIAISGFYEVMMYLNEDNSQPKYDDVVSSVKDVCNSNWTRIKRIYWPLFERGANVPSTVCYDATYGFELLTTGYKFSKFAWNQLTFEDSIDDADMGWAMGYMINQTNWLQSKHQSDHFLPSSAFVYGLLVLFAIFFLASVAFALTRLIRRCRRTSRKPYKKFAPTPPPHYGAI